MMPYWYLTFKPIMPMLRGCLFVVYLRTTAKRAFPVSDANFWNTLPSHVTSAPSLAIFRQRLKDISLSPVISGLNLLICSLLHCGHSGPSDNFCYLGQTKNPDDDDDDDDDILQVSCLSSLCCG